MFHKHKLIWLSAEIYPESIQRLGPVDNQYFLSSELHRGSYMSTHVLLNLLNELNKSDKIQSLQSILSPFRNKFNKFNNSGAQM